MYSWIVRRALRVLEKHLNAGDVPALMKAFDDDAHLVFPGDSSFAGDHRGKPAIEAWIARFVSLRPSFAVHDVAAAGPPWNMRVMIRFSDRIATPGGWEYRNEGMEFLRLRWGKVVEQRVHLDTQKVAELDARLEPATA